MAELEARGYVKNPQLKLTSAKKPYATYGLNVKQKGKPGQDATYAFFNVTDWNAQEAPPDGAFATVKGWFTVRKYIKDGQDRQSLDINAQTVEVSPPREGISPLAAADAAPQKDPWE